MVEIVTIEIMS